MKLLCFLRLYSLYLLSTVPVNVLHMSSFSRMLLTKFQKPDLNFAPFNSFHILSMRSIIIDQKIAYVRTCINISLSQKFLSFYNVENCGS